MDSNYADSTPPRPPPLSPKGRGGILSPSPLGGEGGGCLDVQKPVMAERQIVLANLIVLGQVRIVIILAVPFGESGQFAVQSHRRLESEIERGAIHYREHAAHPDAHQAG